MLGKISWAMKGWSKIMRNILMLGKFCPAMRSLLPNLLGKKLMNIHSLIRVRARKICSSLHISYNYLSVRK